MDLAWPSLNDSVHDSQYLFRRVLTAMSEPGTVHMLDLPAPPQPELGAALWGMLLTLCDLDTSVWIAPDLDSHGLREALIFHTGAGVVATPEEADFALLTPVSLDSRITFAMGSDAYPDRSTTLLVEVPELTCLSGWRLTGPGIAESRDICIGDSAGCRALMNRMAANQTTFPCGLDVILGAEKQLAAIPRSTCITRMTAREVN